MDEYIKREAAYYAFYTDDTLSGYEKAYCREIIKNVPAADVDPVRHGRFVHDGPRFDGAVDWWHCSSCGGLVSGVETRFDYCPYCGAKMDMEE